MSIETSSSQSLFNEKLATYRAGIDAIDEKLIALIIERSAIVKNVGAMKRAQYPGKCPIRSGREAGQVRKIAARFKDETFPAGYAAQIWRTLINGALAIEGDITASAFFTKEMPDCYWLAREYFGMFTPLAKQASVKRVIGDVMDNRAMLGIVPLPHSEDADPWWMDVIGSGDERVYVFARLPFMTSEKKTQAQVSALAFAKVMPEATDDDISYIVLRVEDSISQHKLQGEFSKRAMEAGWIQVVPSSSFRYHLIEIKGFITLEDERLKAIMEALGNNVVTPYFLGAYATPLAIETIKS